MNLPFLTADLPGIGGVLRSTDGDFVVDEELPYAASGVGDHVFARIEKRGMTTPHAVGAIARALAVRDRDIGVAGLKDRRAITRQWISLPPPTSPEAVLALALPDITILEAIRHNHKLRTGHVRANRFVLRIRNASADAATRARAILDRLAAPPGAPNWYGEQRFGRYGDNAARGRAMLAAPRDEPRKRDRRMDRFMISALQSELFNAWLRARVTDGLCARVLAGDVLHKVGGGLFTCEDAATDEARLLAGEVIVTGPMFGTRMRDATGVAGEREAAILAAAGIDRAAFARVANIAEGTRRDASIAVTEIAVREVIGDASALSGGAIPGGALSGGAIPGGAIPGGGAMPGGAFDAANPRGGLSTLELAFALPAGAYATAVMREVMKTGDGEVDAPPEAT